MNSYKQLLEAVVLVQRCSVKKVFLEISQSSQKNTCARVSFLVKLQASGLQFIKNETLAQVFSYEFCEISKKTFFYRAPLVAAFKLLLSRCFLKDSVRWNLQQRVIETSIIIHFDIGYIFHIIENLSNNQTSSQTGNCSRYPSECCMKERERERKSKV